MKALGLLRHGLAEGPGDNPPLSEEGIARMQLEARALASLGLRFSPIFCSPLERARMTAEVVAARAASGGASPRVTDLLLPGCEVADVNRLLTSDLLADAEQVLLVGHAPDLGRVAASLVGAPRPFSLGRGDLCLLSTDAWPPQGETMLEWLVPAELLARLGGAEPGP